VPRNPEVRKRSRVTYKFYHKLAVMMATGAPIESVLNTIFYEQNRQRAFKYRRLAVAAKDSIGLVVSDQALLDRQHPLERRIAEWHEINSEVRF